VTETNGDNGATADCQLWIDGELVDVSRDIWVDAGDAVTCAFTYTFPDDGPHTVEIRLLPDPTMNADLQLPPTWTGDRVTAVSPNVTSYRAVVHDRTETTSWRLDYDWANPVTGSNKTYRSNDSEAHRTQTVNVTGGVNRAVAFPLLNVSLSLESGGTAWQAEAWGALVPVVNPTTGEACVTRDVPEHQAVFYVCGAGGAGSFGYSRLAGTVTYHSDAYIRLFDGLTGVQDVWGWNDTYQTQPYAQIKPFGDDVTLRISVTDATGTWGVQPTVTLSPYTEPDVTVEPYTCVDSSPYWLDGGNLHWCTWRQTSAFGRRGESEG
jgi:hypothetical protein